jgi:epoxide hydrolase-like predicted phosphatase
MTVRAVIWDLGGVIVRTENREPRTAFGARFGMSYEEIDRFVFGGETAKKASVGLIREEEHWRDVARRLGVSEDQAQALSDQFFGGDVIDRSLLGFISSLRPRFKTGVISNAWSGLRAYMIREKFIDPFDQVIISAEAGIAKPDPRIYALALDKLAVAAHETIFVDDFIENINACNALGMIGIHFRSAEQALMEINTKLNS